MNRIYFHKIEAMDVIPEKDNLTNVVKRIHWRYNGREGQISDGIFGVIDISEPSSNNFINFEQLTDNDVKSWLFSVLNEENLKTQVDEKIDERLNPKIIQKKPPWEETRIDIPSDPVDETQSHKELAIALATEIKTKIEEVNALKTELDSLMSQVNSAN